MGSLANEEERAVKHSCCNWCCPPKDAGYCAVSVILYFWLEEQDTWMDDITVGETGNGI